MTSYYIAVAKLDRLIRFMVTFLLVCLLLTISFPFLINQGVLVFSELLAISYFMLLFTMLSFLLIFGMRKIYIHEQVSLSEDRIISAHQGSFLFEDIQKIKSYNFLGWKFSKIKMKNSSSYIFGPYQALQKEAIATYLEFKQRVNKLMA